MESVAIFPVPNNGGGPLFRAVARTGQSEGRTAGEALDAISSILPQDSSGTMVMIQPFLPDTFFSDAHRRRLEDLMTRWRAARDDGQTLPAPEQAELESLVQLEWEGATRRTAQVLQGPPE